MDRHEFMGFAVEWTDNPDAPCVFYGKRGAIYGAVRRRGSDWCFLVDVGDRSLGAQRRIRGNAWVQIPPGSREIIGAR